MCTEADVEIYIMYVLGLVRNTPAHTDNIYIYIYVCVYIYIYMCVCVCVCVCIPF